MLQAIDYKTGKIRWSHKWEDRRERGLLSTAGNLVFSRRQCGTIWSR